MKNIKLSETLLTSLGCILLVWGAANTYLDIARYGWDAGLFFWFCNLALLGMSFAILTRNRGLLIGWVSIATFTQAFWIVDNHYRMFTGKNLFGLVKYLYQPGYPLDEFVLAHYHYFTIPIALLGILMMNDKRRPYFYIAIMNPIIFGFSYFAFGPQKNINCIHQSCIPGTTEWQGPIYALCFFGIIYSLHFVTAFLLERFMNYFQNSTALSAGIKFLILSLVGSTALTAYDVQYRISLPRITYEQSTGSNDVIVTTLNSRDFENNQFLLTYRIYNSSQIVQNCSIDYEYDGAKKNLLVMASVLPGTYDERATILPYPKDKTPLVYIVHCENPTDAQQANLM